MEQKIRELHFVDEDADVEKININKLDKDTIQNRRMFREEQRELFQYQLQNKNLVSDKYIYFLLSSYIVIIYIEIEI